MITGESTSVSSDTGSKDTTPASDPLPSVRAVANFHPAGIRNEALYLTSLALAPAG